MRKSSVRLSLTVLVLAALPLGCSDPSSPPKGSGGTTSGGSGGSSKGGTGGGSTANGGSGGNAGSGGSATGGAAGSGGSSSGGSGGTSSGGSGGTSSGGTSSGGSGGSGGKATGGGGGSQPGGAGGSGGDATGGTGGGGAGGGGAGGTSVGGAGGTTRRDGGSDALGGNSGDGGPDGEPATDDGGDDTVAGTCEDKSQNNLETDIDCGGGTCPKCGAGGKCKENSDCRSGSCATGKCADPFAANGTVAQVNPGSNMWRITMGTLILEVDATTAGKIAALTLDGTDILVKNMASTGSVFWTGPQNEWKDGWPPPAELETAAYTPSSKDNVLTLTGPTGTTGIFAGLSVTKRYWGNVENQVLTIEYTIKNSGTTASSKAPWEISRVYPGGLTFFPNAEPPVRLGTQYSGFVDVPFTSAEGALWWKYKATEFTQGVKSGADGLEGWAAHVVCGAGLEKTCTKSPVLIKEWPDHNKQAPVEREVELYGDPGHSYVEFEQLGPYESIPAGGTLVWTMHWLLRYLPANVAPTSGSADLLTWVRSQLL